MRLQLWIIVGIALFAIFEEAESKKDKTQKNIEKATKKAQKSAEKEQKKLEKEQKKLEKERRKQLEKEEKQLKGKLAETDSLPLILSCKGKSSYVRTGKISVNSLPVSDKLQSFAEDECDKQMDTLMSTSPNPTSSKCEIWFQGSNFNKNDTDVIRAVYQCTNSKPEKNETWVIEPETETASQKKGGKTVKLKCKKKENAFIDVVSVKVDNALVYGIKFAELQKQNLSKECYGQNVQKLQGQGKKKVKTECDIMNKKEYGGKLEIQYKCYSSGHGFSGYKTGIINL